MSWKEKMKEFGGGDLVFLSEDGETLKFIVVGEPVLLQGKYKGKPSDKIGCPVITADGFQLFVCGKRLARRVCKHETEFNSVAFLAIRHGEQEDADTTYALETLNDSELTAKLFEVKKKEFKPEMIVEAVEAAKEVMSG